MATYVFVVFHEILLMALQGNGPTNGEDMV